MDEETLNGYTLKEAAVRLGMKPRGVLNAVDRGDLPAQKVANRPHPPIYRIPRAAVEAYAAKREACRYTGLPEHLREVVVSLPLAARIARRSHQALHRAAQEQILRAERRGGWEWQTRLGDLEEWVLRPGRGRRRLTSREFDQALLAEIDRLRRLGLSSSRISLLLTRCPEEEARASP